MSSWNCHLLAQNKEDYLKLFGNPTILTDAWDRAKKPSDVAEEKPTSFTVGILKGREVMSDMSVFMFGE